MQLITGETATSFSLLTPSHPQAYHILRTAGKNFNQVMKSYTFTKQIRQCVFTISKRPKQPIQII
jgi:tRNA(His) 5'-end guanylyltransferase